MGIKINPGAKINDLTVGELRKIISEVVAEILEDILEEREALSSNNFINSIKEAREDYKSGEFTNIGTTKNLDRITVNPNVMGGKPCIRGLRVTVGTIVGLVASGHSFQEILEAYPYLEHEDIKQALSYAAWRSEELDVPVKYET